MKEHFMKEALNEAKKAELVGDVPIGCVIVLNNKIIARGYNTRNNLMKSLGHAEINAINEASQYLNNWVLEDCELYVTLEPCQMCSGAIIQARIKKVYFGASDPKSGCVTSLYNLLSDERFNHQVEYEAGILEAECSTLVKEFFKRLRREKHGKY